MRCNLRRSKNKHPQFRIPLPTFCIPDNRRVVVDYGDKDTIPTLGYPDGMTIDTEDKIWVACVTASKVVRFDPLTGMTNPR